MEKTVNINLAGQLFRIDEEAFQTLSRYLERVAGRFRGEPGSEETIDDIETRIAEIFGGGNEPPLLVSKEMVENMIKIMGSPEEYSDDNSARGEGASLRRNSLYDADRLFTRAGQAVSSFGRTCGRLLSGVLRTLAVLLGTVFAIIGFALLFFFILVFFYNDAPFMQSALDRGIDNLPMLLSIALNGDIARTIWMLAALVILIPLAALSYLGIKMVFRIREGSRAVRMTAFIVWVASACGLAVLLMLRLSTYGVRERVEEKIKLDTVPKIVWIAPLKKSSETGFDEKATVGGFHFWRDTSANRLYGTPELYIFGSDTTSAWISVEKKAYSTSEAAAWANASKIDFGWKWAGDTLYLDEYFSLPPGAPWNGSTVVVDLSLPEGAVVKPVAGGSLPAWRFRVRRFDATQFRIEDGGVQEIRE